MGFTADIVQNGKRYMLLTDTEDLWVSIARTVTCGWDVPDDVLHRSFAVAGRACMPGTCQDGLFSHWVGCVSDYSHQITHGNLPMGLCQRTDECPLYRGAGGSCDGWVVAQDRPTVSDMASWLTWDALVQLHQELGLAISSEQYAQLKARRYEYRIPKYWHIDEPTTLAAEIMRHQVLCEDLIAFGPPEVDNKHIALSLRPTETFFDKVHEIRSVKTAPSGASRPDNQDSNGFSPALVIAGLLGLSMLIAQMQSRGTQH